MSLTCDARLVVDSELGPHKFNHIATVSADSWKAAVRLATAYIEAGRVDGGGCLTCGGCGSVDSGGFTPYGSPIDVPCPDCGTEDKDRQIANLTTRLATVSAELAEHKRRLLEQSATLNAVRQERDHALLVVADLLDGADEHWQKTPRGVSVMAAGRELFAERKAGCE